VFSSVVISLPIADRRRSFGFYRDVLGLEAIGEPAADGVPEPLQFALNDGTRLVLVPTRGFGWVIGDREPAPRGYSECILGLEREDEAGVRELFERAREAGAKSVSEPAPQPWGYSAVFADPDGHLWMVTARTSA
jgi:predicted lactoylglutathione lyase